MGWVVIDILYSQVITFKYLGMALCLNPYKAIQPNYKDSYIMMTNQKLLFPHILIITKELNQTLYMTTINCVYSKFGFSDMFQVTPIYFI